MISASRAELVVLTWCLDVCVTACVAESPRVLNEETTQSHVALIFSPLGPM